MTVIKDILKQNKRLYRISKVISDLSEEIKVPVFLVGGCVRDLLLEPEKNSVDIDLMVEGDGIEFANQLGKKLNVSTVVPFPKFATARIPYKECEIEVASARLESYDPKSRKPKDIIMTDINEDLQRRDFTVNAMAISLQKDNMGTLIDPFDGFKDLNAKVLRTPMSNSDITFSDDPLRMMRAAYFSAKLEMKIDKQCLQSIKDNAKRISIVSQERITNELLKILGTNKPSVGFIMLQEVGLLEYVFPEISVMYGLDQTSEYHHKDIFFHTLEVVDNAARLSNKLDLRLAALVHDIAKPNTRRIDKKKGYTFYGHDDYGARMLKKISKRMKFSNKTRDYIIKLTALHLRPISLAKKEVTDSAIRRLIVDAQEDAQDLMLLCRADITTKNPNNVKKYLSNFDRVEKRMQDVIESDELRAFQSPVRGHEIMEIFNLSAGKKIGEIKKLVEEAILNGDIDNTHSDALSMLKSLKKTKNFS
jgi:putative nucleotidyltransferase with HDIG domain